jgi:hypothetical protein
MDQLFYSGGHTVRPTFLHTTLHPLCLGPAFVVLRKIQPDRNLIVINTALSNTVGISRTIFAKWLFEIQSEALFSILMFILFSTKLQNSLLSRYSHSSFNRI